MTPLNMDQANMLMPLCVLCGLSFLLSDWKRYLKVLGRFLIILALFMFICQSFVFNIEVLEILLRTHYQGNVKFTVHLGILLSLFGHCLYYGNKWWQCSAGVLIEPRMVVLCIPYIACTFASIIVFLLS